jgi:hypothetical protein
MNALVEDNAEEVTIDRENAGLYLPPVDFGEFSKLLMPQVE